MAGLDQFRRKKYLNLETFRRSGAAVRTPVWFAQEGELLYVITMADSGKVKRIRRDGRVNVAPCTATGRVIGSWVPARAREITDQQAGERVNRLLDRKYGLLKKLFENQRAGRGARDTFLAIHLEDRP